MMLFIPLYFTFFELEILLLEIDPRKSYTDVHRVLYKDVHYHIVYVTQMLVKFTLYFENQKRLTQSPSFGGAYVFNIIGFLQALFFCFPKVFTKFPCEFEFFLSMEFQFQVHLMSQVSPLLYTPK